MKIMLLFLFSICTILAKAATITVNVAISSPDNNIKNIILSKFLDELRSKTSIKISDNNPMFTIEIRIVSIITGNKISGIAMTTILTKRVITNDNRITQEYLNTVVNTLDLDDSHIESKCKELVARFDVDNFQKIK